MARKGAEEASDKLPRISRRVAVAYLSIFAVVPILTFFIGKKLDEVLSLPEFPPFPINIIVGMSVFIFGLAVGIKSTRLLYTVGRGLPWGEATDQGRSTVLVTSGLYAWCRNPMTLGYSLLPCGMGIMFRSLAITILIPITVFSIMIVWLKIWEEPRLERRFGKAYREYKQRTPFLIPDPKLLTCTLTRLVLNVLQKKDAQDSESDHVDQHKKEGG